MLKSTIAVFALCFIVLPVFGLTIKDSTINGQANKLITWTDLKGLERKAGIRTDGPIGVSAYMTYYDGATKVTITGSGSGGSANAGFGGIIHHGSGGSSGGNLAQRWVGSSMAIFDYKQTVDATLETATYTFMDGHDYFQYAITDDCRAGTGGGDTRTPYCTIDWNAQGLKAQGLEYGAQKYFKQPLLSDLSGNGAWNAWSGPFTFGGTCDIPYAWEWAGGKEIGFIQSQTFSQQNAGTPTWSANIPASGPHFATYWPSDSFIGISDYQMNFYDNYGKITWGQPYGWMNASNGAGALAALKNKWGQYSLSILVDTKADSGVMRIRDENRAIHTAKAVLAVSPGTVKDSGQVGTANTARQRLSPLGYDHNYRAWYLTAASNNEARLDLTVTGTVPLMNPTFRIANMTALPSMVTYKGATLVSGTGYYASYDATNSEVWITIVGSFLGSNPVGINLATPVLQRLFTQDGKPSFKAEKVGQGNDVLFTFYAPASGMAKLSLYNHSGRLVANVFEGAAAQGINVKTCQLKSAKKLIRNGPLVAEYSFEGRKQFSKVFQSGR